jgi:hypothetical protein
MSTERNLSTDDLLVDREDNTGEDRSAPESPVLVGQERAASTGSRPDSRGYDEGSDAAITRDSDDASPARERSVDASDPGSAPLFAREDADRYREQWREVQGQFVDRPREAVQEADRLVAELMQRLAAQFSESRQGLERQWDGDDDVSTEELRVALTRYRSFFERLLSA